MSSLPASFRIRPLQRVGQVTVASYAPRGFEQLSPAQRVLAYHLSAGALAADSLFTRQTSRYALPARRLVRDLLTERAGALPPALREHLREYRRSLFVHHGLHDKISGAKVPPPLARADFEQALRLQQRSAPRELLAALFEPSVLPILVQKSARPGTDPLLESAVNHYEGLSSRELAGHEERFPLNGRLVKRGERIEEQIYRAGNAATPPGLGSEQLARLIQHLDAAQQLAPPEQARALGLLSAHFQTGDPELKRQHDIVWLAQRFAVDYVIGFQGTHLDVRERKGCFGAFVCIADPDFDPPIQALARAAAELETLLPWRPEYRRTIGAVPAAAAVTTLAATGDLGPLTFGGINLPDERDLQEQHGTKTLLNVSAEEARRQLSSAALIDEFAPEELRPALKRWQPFLDQAFVGLHEVKGHGSGQVDPALRGDPAALLAPWYSTLEEARADLVADYLALAPESVALGLLPTAECARLYPSASVLRNFMALLTAPRSDHVEGAHLSASLLQLGWLLERGAIQLEQRAAKTFPVVRDPAAWREAVAELLIELQRIKATGDRPAIERLVVRHGTRIDPRLHAELLGRRPQQSVAVYIAIAPPLITPILDAAGRAVDARAEQVSDFDVYIDALEAADPDFCG